MRRIYWYLVDISQHLARSAGKREMMCGCLGDVLWMMRMQIIMIRRMKQRIIKDNCCNCYGCTGETMIMVMWMMMVVKMMMLLMIIFKLRMIMMMIMTVMMMIVCCYHSCVGTDLCGQDSWCGQPVDSWRDAPRWCRSKSGGCPAFWGSLEIPSPSLASNGRQGIHFV